MTNEKRHQQVSTSFFLWMWNQSDRTVVGRDRTNNHAEAAHRKMHTELRVSHPIIWKFFDGLKKVQKGRDVYYE